MAGDKLLHFCRFLFVCLIVFASSAVGLRSAAAQDAAPESAPEQIVAETPILATLSRTDPEKASTIAIKIIQIGEHRLHDTLRGSLTPTEAERVQLAANPAFARAYNIGPERALRLLRQVNAAIAKSRAK